MENINRRLNKFQNIMLNCFPSIEIEKCINDCIDEFDFNEAKEVFTRMNYKWLGSDGYYIPDTDVMKEKCKELFYEAFAKLIVKNTDDYYVSSGRFKSNVFRRKEEDSYKYYANLEFVPISAGTDMF